MLPKGVSAWFRCSRCWRSRSSKACRKPRAAPTAGAPIADVKLADEMAGPMAARLTGTGELIGNVGVRRETAEDFWALRNVSLTIGDTTKWASLLHVTPLIDFVT